MDRATRKNLRSSQTEMIKQALIRIAAAAAVLVMTGSAYGSETLLQRTAAMITSPHIALDLRLTAAQVSQRDLVIAAFQTSREEIVRRMEAGPRDQLDAGTAELDRAQVMMNSELLAILNPSQTKRLKQLAIQQAGTEALLDDAVAKDMALTLGQASKIKAILAKVALARDAYDNALGEAMSKIPEPGSDSAAMSAYTARQKRVVSALNPKRQQYLATLAAGDKKIMAVLTPTQKQRWVALKGKPPKSG
jgi:hypothetical protein